MYLIFGKGHSMRLGKLIIPILNANTIMLMQPACGWLKIPNGSM